MAITVSPERSPPPRLPGGVKGVRYTITAIRPPLRQATPAMRPVARRRLGNTRVRGTSTIAAGIGSTGPDLAWDRRRSGSVPPDPPPLTREGPGPVPGTGPLPG